MEEPSVNFQNLDGFNSVVDDLLWPFQKYNEVRDFVSREGPASLAIGLTGILLTEVGVSPGIAAAVGILGFSTSITKFVLMILFSTEKPLDDLGIRGGGLSTAIFVVMGFGLFIIYGPGDLVNLSASLAQFGIGLGITYLAGYTYMRTHTNLEKAGASVSAKVGLPVLVSLGVVLGLVTFTPALFSNLGQETAVELLTEKPASINISSPV